MKILFVTNMYPVEDYIYFGIHVKEQIQSLEALGNVNAEICFINGREHAYNYLKSIFKVNSLIRKNGYDIIHVHFGLSGLFLLFNPFQKVPVVLTIHGSDINSDKMGGMLRNITKLVVKMAKRVIVMNDKMIAKLSMYKNKVVKIPCGINTDQFKEISVSKDPEKITIGFPGNNQRPEKNYKLFQDIIEKLKPFAAIEVIEFHNMTREQVLENLNRIDLLLLTSLSEGSPQVIKEAMACNKPIVSTDVGDVKAVLEGVKNAYVINSFNADDFISPVKAIIDLPAEERKSNGREQLLKIGLDAQSIAKSIYKLYTELV